MVQNNNRSAAYQYLFREVVVEYNFYCTFTNDASIEYLLNPFAYNEDLMDLEDKLKDRVNELLLINLSDNHYKIIKLHLEDFTQIEISKQITLKVNQSSIHNSIKVIVKKMRAICSNDTICKQLLFEMNELRELRF